MNSDRGRVGRGGDLVRLGTIIGGRIRWTRFSNETFPHLPPQGLCWAIDDAFLREPGPRAEGIVGTEDVLTPSPPDMTTSTVPVTPALYVSPTSGQLNPGEESRIRLTFTPKRAGALSFALPVSLTRVPVKGARPYLKLRVQVRVECVLWGERGGRGTGTCNLGS